ncbi:DeoR/GlpR family DNA-binding transcription regulator [Wenxinia marina]|uniref:Transcriptional regulator of sugar metabolism n=1 Tax=Wenxinia marina DSM 24838 TaxID=1123501 RepID=A0A0D0QGX1_9RHOB|nr:DeoR/GlpR family DNA-binding transcription regulator [Wenxinia marina]KIQ70253.1 Transcriptional regulator of sugar metabolism [Wenxinia marina DSM 24838]GGL49999.1 DeoR family transcriptional regulator [Wenxinia marina]
MDSGIRLRKADRRDRILAELRLSPHLRSADLAERFGVSAETIRRDVEALEAEGRLVRAHGGVTALPGGRPDLAERSRERLVERERIGRTAAALVVPGQTLMIDAGSTTLQFARHLAFRGIAVTAVTNSLSVALALGRGGAARIVLCPGDYLPGEEAVVGAETVAFLSERAVDVAVIGATALDARGASEAVPGFAAVKRAMLARGRQGLLLCDAAKFGLRRLEPVAPPGGISGLVADRAPPPDLSRALSEGGCTVHVAEPG